MISYNQCNTILKKFNLNCLLHHMKTCGTLVVCRCHSEWEMYAKVQKFASTYAGSGQYQFHGTDRGTSITWDFVHKSITKCIFHNKCSFYMQIGIFLFKLTSKCKVGMLNKQKREPKKPNQTCATSYQSQ